MIWDKTIKVGDIITAYHKGYHRVTKIEDRGSYGKDYTPLIHYDRVLTADFKPSKASKQCDAAYCTKITLKGMKAERNKRVDTLLEGYLALEELLV